MRLHLMAFESRLPPLSASADSGCFLDAPRGWVTEWSIVHAWKACVPKGTAGSNPAPSARLRLDYLRAAARAILWPCTGAASSHFALARPASSFASGWKCSLPVGMGNPESGRNSLNYPENILWACECNASIDTPMSDQLKLAPRRMRAK